MESSFYERFANQSDKRQVLINGSCQCKSVEYEVLALPKELSHCYCSMCSKLHGSALAVYVPLSRHDLRFTKFGKQTQYRSSDRVTRTFCSECGSNLLFWFTFQTETIWITPSTFDESKTTNAKAQRWWLDAQKVHIYHTSKCKWHTIANDGAPRYVTEPATNFSKL